MSKVMFKHDLIGALRRGSIKEGAMINDITQSMDEEGQFGSLFWFVDRLDSIHNFFKVESHAILTRSLFLMYTHQFTIDFTTCTISYVDTTDELRTVYWRNNEELNLILYMFMEQTKYSEELSYRYDFYRNATRDITDHLEEDHNPRETWRSILKLTKHWFEEN